MEYTSWEEHLYDSTFDKTFDALLAEYDEGKLTLEELQRNVDECHITMLNASTEGAAKFQYCSALTDAHQYALAVIKKKNNL